MQDVAQGESGFGFKSIFQENGYGVDLDLTYQVDPKHSHPDYYFETHAFSLFSERLIALMTEFGVCFEAFPVTMVDKNGDKIEELRYFIFHLLEGTLNSMDTVASEWQGDWNIGVPRLVLDLNEFEHRPMFTCNHVRVPLMRDDLKKAIQQGDFTGFDFLAPEKFRSGKYGAVANYDD